MAPHSIVRRDDFIASIHKTHNALCAQVLDSAESVSLTQIDEMSKDVNGLESTGGCHRCRSESRWLESYKPAGD